MKLGEIRGQLVADRDRIVDITPVGRNRRLPPRAQNVEQHGADRDKNKCKRYGHPGTSLPLTKAVWMGRDDVSVLSRNNLWSTLLAAKAYAPLRSIITSGHRFVNFA